MNTFKKFSNCPQEVLYLVCMAGWNLCAEFLSNFTAFRAVYTPAFISDAIQAVQNAKALTPSRKTMGDRKLARIACANAAKLIQTDWQRLKAYISNAFPKDQVKARLEVAGASLYKKVTDNNWSAVHSLIDAANNFIADNLDALTANGNMPVDFQAGFLADGNSFIEISAIFFQANIEKKQFTAQKLDANNAIYESLITMLKDGQQIFSEDKSAREQFVFEQLKASYKGGSASLVGYATNGNMQPVEGAVITSSDARYTDVTNKKGYYRISRIAEGTYNFTLTCPGYAPVDFSVTFIAGKKRTADVTLVNVMKKAA